MNPPGQPVLVVGAGPTGLMLACELARRGLPPRVIDRAGGPDPLSRAVCIHARSLELLDELGLADQAVAEGVPIRTVDVRDRGHLRASFDFGLADSRYTFALDLPQARTEALLRGHLSELGVEVEWATELTGLRDRPDGAEVQLRRGDVSEQLVVGWVCGCDGVRSTVRKLSGITFDGDEDPEGWALVEGSLDWDLSPNSWHIFMGRQGILAACAVPGGGYRLAANMDPVAAEHAQPPSLEEFQRVLSDRGQPGARLKEITWSSPFRIHERLASSFGAGRVLLAGDAAHAQSPSTGQGMNTGLQDAWNLGWKLAMVADGRAPAKLLESYDTERRHIARGSISFTHALTRLGEMRGRGADLLRDVAEPIAGHLPALARYLIDRVAEVHLRYRGSPIVLDRRRGHLPLRDGVHAGDRLPDIELPASGQRLYRLLHGREHVLLTLGDASTLPEVARSLEQVQLEPEDTAVVSSRIGIAAPAWIAVRPDRHIGYLGHGADGTGLEAYMKMWSSPVG